MANPRKFSEKIALHNQKQAEETAAFEAIMREVSGATRGAYQKQQLHIAQNLGAYRGGSLPNVNQLGTNSVDLQSALHNLEDMKQGRQTLVDRLHRERNRQLQSHNRGKVFPFDKRVDVSPYGSTYLSPPPDTSWRRTNSDSALHTSVMAPPSDQLHGATTPPTHRRIVEMIGNDSVPLDAGQLKAYWDPKKLAQSRPKSCEVPGINIYPSAEQDSGVHIPISNNTGSLPDLTNLHFPSPLATPLDAEDQTYPQGSPVNLSPTTAHQIAGVRAPQQTSPTSRRRHPHSGPSPLVLHGSPTQMRHNMAPQGPILNTTRMALGKRLQYQLYHPRQHHSRSTHPSHQEQQQQQQQQQQQLQQQQQQQLSQQLAAQIQQQQLQARLALGHNHQHHHVSQQQHVDSVTDSQGASMTQYRNSQSDGSCQSPTSPLSQPSYSPSQSPGLPPSTINNSPFADAYFIQQQQQTNALQHQFEQFNMLQDNQPTTNGNTTMYSVAGGGGGGGQQLVSLQYSQANMHGLKGSQEFVPPQQQQQQQQNTGYYQQQQTSPQQQSPQHQAQPQQSPVSPVSPLSPQNQSGSSQATLPQDPSQNVQAGSKIPDIILTAEENTDFLPFWNSKTSLRRDGGNSVWNTELLWKLQKGVDEAARQDFAKEIGNAMAGMPDAFDSELFPSDEALKVGLDPLDLDGLQMLTDPNLVADPATEDSFRLDKL